MADPYSEGVPQEQRGNAPTAAKEESWAEMTTRERDAVVALGFDQQRWDTESLDEPLIYDRAWASLSAAQQAAAATLGMVAEEFADFVKPEPQVPQEQRGNAPTAAKEESWAEMTTRERDAVVALGFDQQRWDTESLDEPLIYDRAWASLSAAQQAAAATLGMVAEEFADFVKPEPQPSWRETEPEPEPEPELRSRSSSPSMALRQREPSPVDELEGLRQKIHEFLDEVGIGSPGAEGATSNRGFDSAPLIEFAHAHKLHFQTADEIYAEYVKHQMMEIERALRSSEHVDAASTRTLPEVFGPTSECM